MPDAAGTRTQRPEARRRPPLGSSVRARARLTVLWCTPRWRAMVPRRHPSTVNSRRISAASRAGITAPPPPAPAAPQEVVPDQRPAEVATDRAAQGRLDGGVGDAGRWRWTRQRCACRHPARALRPWGSLLRHFLRPGRPPTPVGRLPPGVQQAAPTGPLVAPPRLKAAPLPRRPAARAPAVPLPPVAPRAHIHRPRTQVADEPPDILRLHLPSASGTNFSRRLVNGQRPRLQL